MICSYCWKLVYSPPHIRTVYLLFTLSYPHLISSPRASLFPMAPSSTSDLLIYLNRWTLRYISSMLRTPKWYRMVPYPLSKKSDRMFTSKCLFLKKNSIYNANSIFFNRQYRQKKVKHFSRDGSKISYVQNVHFDFDEDASAPFTQNDRIVALNMHMNVSKDSHHLDRSKLTEKFVLWIETDNILTHLTGLFASIRKRNHRYLAGFCE